MARKANRKGPGRKGYGAAFKAKVLKAAQRERLTGSQVKQRFGISTLTFYKWRGPSRAQRPGSRVTAQPSVPGIAMLRKIVRQEILRVLRRLR